MDMFKLVNWGKVAEQIAAQTDENDHSGAVVTLTSAARLALVGTPRFKAADLAAETALKVQTQHLKQTYMTLDLCNLRAEAHRAAREALDGYVPDEDLREIDEAF